MATRNGTARTYDVLMPRDKRADGSVTLADGGFIRRTGAVPGALMAARLPGGSIGVHAAEHGAEQSLCKCSLVSPTKADGGLIVHDACKTAGKNGSALQRVATHVTCKFCLTRLVAAGVVDGDTIGSTTPATSRAYALAYGSVTADDALAAIEQRATEAAAAAEAAKAKRQRGRKAGKQS